MKKIFTLFIIVFALFITSAYAQISGLIAYYPFSGNANDFSGNGINGTVYGATLTTDRFGADNSAYSFNGYSDYISLPSNDFLNQNYTFSVWGYTSDLPSYNEMYPVLAIGSSTSAGDQCIGLGNSYSPSYHTGWICWSYSSIGIIWNDVNTLPLADTWYHIVSVRDNSKLSLYVNGVLVSSTSTGYQPYYASSPTASIGRRIGVSQYFSGKIDDVSIYNRALDSTEIKQLYLSVPEYAVEQYTFKAYPNPSNGLIALELQNKENIQVGVININGQAIYNKTFNNTSYTQIDLSNQPKGVYFVKIIGEKGVSVEKVVIQ